MDIAEIQVRNSLSQELFMALELSPTLKAMKNSPVPDNNNKFRKVQDALKEFVARVPINILEELSKKFDGIIIEASLRALSAAIIHESPGATLWLFPHALRSSKSKLLGIIAHEMAHLYIGPQIAKMTMTRINQPECEDEADILASQWGFKEVFEIHLFPLVDSNRKYWPK